MNEPRIITWGTKMFVLDNKIRFMIKSLNDTLSIHRNVDLTFFNKNIVRNLYLFKLANLNLIQKSYCIPALSSLHLVFFLNNLTDFDDLSSSNYMYLLKYFFRSKASICQYTSQFHLGV
jgi:hypothetical protein